MEFKASHRYARMGPRKARLVIELIRGRTVNQALDTLANDNHRASFYVRKVLASAVANALQNPDVRASRLLVSRAYVNEGPLLQGRMRWRPGPMGRAMPFRRRTCHIHIRVQDPDVKVAVLEAPAEAPVEAPEPAEKKADAETKAEQKAPAKEASAKKVTAKGKAPAKGDPSKKPASPKEGAKQAAPKKKAPAKKEATEKTDTDKAEDKD